MIRPEGFRGAAFGEAADGDARQDPTARERLSAALAIPSEWATVRQVHGATVAVAEHPGHLGDADAIVTTVPGLPIVVATADCLPIIIEGDGGVAVVHAGWRGAASGVVAAARQALAQVGVEPCRAAVGPGIGSCCFEVGAEVAQRFESTAHSTTRWGTRSVDLPAVVSEDLSGLDIWNSGVCTYCGDGLNSYRKTSTPDRQVAVAWL